MEGVRRGAVGGRREVPVGEMACDGISQPRLCGHARESHHTMSLRARSASPRQKSRQGGGIRRLSVLRAR